MKKFLIPVIVLVVLVLILGPGKDLALRSAVISGAKSATGADLLIGSFSLSLLKQSVVIRDLKVKNPAGFAQDKVLADIPEISLQLDVPALFKKELHVRYMRLDVKQVRIILDQAGKMNVNGIKLPPQPKDQMPMRFDLVSLNIGQVVMEDYTTGNAQPKVTVMDVALKNKEFRDVKSAQDLGMKVFSSALATMGLEKLFDLKGLNVSETLNSAGQMLKGMFK